MELKLIIPSGHYEGSFNWMLESTTTAGLIGNWRNCIKNIMVQMESRDNNRGLSNLDDIKKNYPIRMILTKVTSKKLKENFLKLRNHHIAVLVPQIYRKWLRKLISGRICVKDSSEMNKISIFMFRKPFSGVWSHSGAQTGCGREITIWTCFQCFVTATWKFWIKNGVKKKWISGWFEEN